LKSLVNIKIEQNLEDAVVVALGSNLPGPYASAEALLEAALASFPLVGLEIVKRSLWWRSAAWPPSALPDYLNGVVLVETKLGARATLAALFDLERTFGRVRGAANAPRTLDLDLIAYGRRVIQEQGLIVPHPRAAERRFVMGPLAQIAPDWTHPVSGLSAAALTESATIGMDARPIGQIGRA
jgi:2-amino-4-hydroxy-6-hydroxymethyldihydropteridine diphosphokinase